MLPAEPAFHAATGQKVALAALPRLRWLANDRPSVSDRVTRLLTIDAWLSGRLDGSDAGASVSNASTTGLLDLASRKWSALDDAPWRQPGDERFAAWLAPLAESGEVTGRSPLRRAGVSACRPGSPSLPAEAMPGRRDGSRVPRTWRPCGHHGIALAVCRHPRAPAHRPSSALPRHRPHHAIPLAGRRIAWSAGLFLDWFVRAFATADGRGSAPSDGHARLATDAASIPPGAGGIVAVGGLPLTGPDWTHAAPSLLGFSLGDAERARPSAYRAIVEAGCLTVAANLDVIADGTRSAEAEGSEITSRAARAGATSPAWRRT